MVSESVHVPRIPAADRRLTEALGAAAEDLPPPEHAEQFGAFFARYGDADIVLLGEATHGSSEFY